MSKKLQYKMVDGIKCYSSRVADSYDDYPDEGFDVTDKLEAESFWVRSRNRLIRNIINKNIGAHIRGRQIRGGQNICL